VKSIRTVRLSGCAWLKTVSQTLDPKRYLEEKKRHTRHWEIYHH
jgi:hypothetical protein